MNDCGHVCAHYERSVKKGHYSNKDIDENKIHLDYNIGPERSISQTNYIRENLKKIAHAKRKDLVVMATIVLDAPKNLPYEMHERFFELSYKFLIERYGTDNEGTPLLGKAEDICISCYRHQSEKTDHIHFAMLPINKTESGELRFQAREKFNREDLQTLHQDLDAYLKGNNIRADIINGKTQRDAYGRALSVKELKHQTYKRQHNRNLERTIGGRF